MRAGSALVLVWLGGVAALAQDVPELVRASEELAKTRQLVEAGVMPRAKLAESEERLADARDEAVLQRTLYGELGVEDLTEQQAEDMVGAAERRLARRAARVEEAKKLVEAGAASRLSLTPLLEELDDSRKVLGLAESRARLLRQVAEMARAEEWLPEPAAGLPAGPLPVAERFDGNGAFSPRQLDTIALAFQKEFARPLPVSARGQTAVHRALGFDHRGRVDVAVNPDQPEGVWLRRFLEALRIPYFAFRSFVPGSSTAPHIHIGPASLRIGGG